jgi:hypothetical protein
MACAVSPKEGAFGNGPRGRVVPVQVFTAKRILNRERSFFKNAGTVLGQVCLHVRKAASDEIEGNYV